MREQIEEVLLSQTEYTPKNSDAMLRRGVLIRKEMTAWLADLRQQLADAVAIPVEDLLIEGRDGTGLKSEIPWVRFSSKQRSPAATEGWYVVYLIAADGESCYLSLNQGTTRWDGGE